MKQTHKQKLKPRTSKTSSSVTKSIETLITSTLSNETQTHFKNIVNSTIQKYFTSFMKINTIFQNIENDIQILDIIINPIDLTKVFPTKREILKHLNVIDSTITMTDNELELYLIKNPNILFEIETLFYRKKFSANIVNKYPNIYKYQLENSIFMSASIQECIHNSITHKITIHYKFKDVKGTLQIFNSSNNGNMNQTKARVLAMPIIKRICFFNKILNVEKIPIFRVYICSQLKRLSENGVFTPNNVNTAATDGTTILIWRQEELLKSILHESIHFHNLDWRGENKSIGEIIHGYSVKNSRNEVLTFEAYTEALAEILNVLFLVGKDNDMNENLKHYMLLEFEFGFFQMCKLLNHLKVVKWNDFYGGDDIFSEHKLIETTSTFCYFILKSQLLWHFDVMIDTLFSENKINLKCTEKYINIYNKLWINIKTDKIFIKCVNNALKKIRKFNGKNNLISFDKLDIMKTMRMSIIDLFYS